MNGRTIGKSVAVVLGVAVVGGGAWYGIAKLRARPMHELVITYHRHATTALANDDQLAGVTARTLAFKSPRIKRIRSESTRDRVRIECSFDSPPVDYDDDKYTIKKTTEQVLHMLDTEEAPPDVEDAEPPTRMWVVANKDLYATLDEIRGVTVWHGCGAPLPKRFRVQLVPAKLEAYKVDLTDFILEVEHEVGEATADAYTTARLADFTVKGRVKLGQIAGFISEDVRPPPCTALGPDGESIITLRAQLHPKISAEDRGKFNAVIKDANGTLVGDKDYTEVRFFPNEGMMPAQQVVLARGVLDSAKAALPVIAMTMTSDGVGTLIVKSEAKDDAIRAFFAKTPTTIWGGIRGRRYLLVTTHDRDRNIADRQAQILEKKISGLEGVGKRIMTAPPPRVQLAYDIDGEKAMREVIETDLLRALIPLDADQDATLPVLFDAPLDAIKLRGRPFSTYVTMRTTMGAPRLVRINAMPAAELRWEVSDPKTVKHVREVVFQAVGDSATVEDVPATP